MFPGLGDTDWSSFGKHLGFMRESSDIPRWIQQLLADERAIRIDAIDNLFGIQQHTGILAKATPHFLPFVLQVLALRDYPEKAYILRKLDALGGHILGEGRNISRTRLALNNYDALVMGLNVYLESLNDDVAETRFYTARLLRYLQEAATEVLPALMRRFEGETNQRVRVTIIRSMGQLMNDAYLMYDAEYGEYISFIASKVIDGVSISERFAAAEELIQMRCHTNEELKNAIEVIMNEFKLNQSDFDDSFDPIVFENYR